MFVARTSISRRTLSRILEPKKNLKLVVREALSTIYGVTFINSCIIVIVMLETFNIDLTWAPPVLAFLSVLGVVAGMIRWLVKHYLDEMKAEFKPNGGGSMKDAVNRLERDQKKLYEKIEKVEEDNKENMNVLAEKIDHMYTTIIRVLGNKS